MLDFVKTLLIFKDIYFVTCDLNQLGWSEELESGIQDIDRQHHHLLKLLKNMSKHPGISGNSELFSDLLNEFNQAVIKHFDYEETLLSKLGYEHLEAHKEQREEILIQLAEVCFSASFEANDAPKDFIEVLCEWFEQHLREEDTQYFGKIKESLIKLR